MAGIKAQFTLNNDITMPQLGLGVYQSSSQETQDSVGFALQAGYRLIDTAAIYGNERDTGKAILASDVGRDEIFLTTKLWIHDYGKNAAERAFEASIDRLGLDYIDLWLLHWPVPGDFDATVESYLVAEKLLRQGRIKAIGVSNFETQHFDRLMERASVVPAVNQIELHPYFQQRVLREKHREMGIVTQAWSPLGGVNIYDEKDPQKQRHLLEDPMLQRIASDHGKSTAQVVLRWHLQSDISIIPKSIRQSRVEANAALFDFALSDAEMQQINFLDSGIRGGPDPEMGDRQRFQFVVTP